MDMLPEQKALDILEKYQGTNDYINELQYKVNKRNFPLNRNQSEYIINNHEYKPKIAKKYIKIDEYFGKKIMEELLLTVIPNQIWVEKLLTESDKAYHILGKRYSGETLCHFWIPKTQIIPDKKDRIFEIDYTKYEHRMPMEHQKLGIQKLLNNNKFILADDMGVGKEEYIENRLFTPYGRKRIGDIIVGDYVIGSDGNKIKVIGVYPQGVKKLYRVSFNDKSSILVGEEHLWCVYNRDNRRNTHKYITLTTNQLIDKNLILINNSKKYDYKFKTYYKESNNNNKWRIPIVKPIQFKNKGKLPIDPYLLGIILGDGCIGEKDITITLHKNDYEELIGEFPHNKKKIYKNITNSSFNYLLPSIIKLGLKHKRSYEKFVPDIYKYSSIEDRIKLLRGLMDTDGTVSKGFRKNRIKKTNIAQYCSVSKQLIDDVVEIVNSLGGIARISKKQGKYKKDGKVIICKMAYNVSIKLPNDINPFKLKRKADIYKPPTKYKVSRYITSIEFEKYGEAVCIKVDAPDHLYVTEHAIITHNTTTAVMGSIESNAKKILIVCPKSLKLNWKREIEHYTPSDDIVIIDGKKWNSAKYIIINYDILKNFHSLDKENPITTLIDENFDLAIIDEAHAISNTSKRTKLTSDILSKINKVWLLTGTPVTSRPINYYNLLKVIGNPVANNWIYYIRRYCDGKQIFMGRKRIWKTDGASNLEELHEKTKHQVLRRLKEDVLDLPEKIRTPVYLKMNSAEYEQEMGEYLNWLDENQDKSLSIQLNKIVKIRQIIANEKIPYTIELTENALDQDKKVIIFTNFTDPLMKLHEYFGKQSVVLHGQMKDEDRQKSIDDFQNDPKIKIFISNMKAGGVGITLTAAEVEIMNDLPFVPYLALQCEDRSYRKGQRNNVNIFYPLFENTMEMVIYDMLNKKKQNINTIIGDAEDDVFKIVLENLK